MLVGALLAAGALGMLVTGNSRAQAPSGGAATGQAIAPFSGVRAGSVFEISIRKGKSPTMDIEAPAHVLPLVRSEVADGVLRLRLDEGVENLNVKHPIRVRLTTAHLKYLDISGASSVKMLSRFTAKDMVVSGSGASRLALDMAADTLKLDLAGASQVVLHGSSKKLAADLSGASGLDASDARVSAARVDVSGASTARLRVKDRLDVDASGVSSVRYQGNPAHKNIHTSSMSSVEQD